MFSIIIPLYNREEFIVETIESVINQSYQNWECIVVDDGSTDKSCDLVATMASKDSRIKLYNRKRLPKNANTCRNIGIELSNGDYLIFLDSDDLLLPHCLELRKNHLLKNPNINLLVTGTGNMKDNPVGKYNMYGILHPPDSNFLDLFLSLHSPWYMTSGTWRKNYIIEIEKFDENLLRLQDPDIHIRALLNDDLHLHYHYQEIDHIYRIHSQRIFSSKDVIQIRIEGYIKFFIKYTNYSNINHVKLEEGINKTIVEFLYSNKISNFIFDQQCQAYFETLVQLNLITARKFKSILAVNKLLKYSPNFRGLGKLLYFITNTLPKSKYA